MCKKNDTSNQKPQRSVSFAPKFPPFKGSCSLQRPLQHRLVDIQREKFFSKSFSRGSGGGPPERGTFFMPQVYERVGILLVKVFNGFIKSRKRSVFVIHIRI